MKKYDFNSIVDLSQIDESLKRWEKLNDKLKILSTNRKPHKDLKENIKPNDTKLHKL